MSQSKERDNANLANYYHDIISCMPNIVYILDRNGMIISANDNLMTLLGIEKLSDLPNTLYTQLSSNKQLSENRAQLLKKYDINVMVGGESKYDTIEPPVIGADGNIIYYTATRVPLKDESNNIQGLVVILTDITERKKLEERLENLQQQKIHTKQRNTFYATLPPGVHRNSEAKPNILLIEDNPIAVKASQSLLLQYDCLVDIATTGEQALTHFKPGKYDIVFMDIGLENDSGYVVSKKIREIEKDSGYRVAIIALTGYDADTVKADCHDYSMEGAITKPLTGIQVKQIIQRYINDIDVPISGLKTFLDEPDGTINNVF